MLNNTRIFPNSTRTARARENAERASRILQQMQQSLRYPHSQTTQQLQSHARQLASALRGTGGQLPVERQLIRMAESVERMAMASQNSFVSQVLGALGQPGQLIQAWLRGREGSQSLQPLKTEIQNAMNILGQFSGDLQDAPLTPEQAGGQRLPDWIEGRNAPPRNSLPLPAGSGGGGGSGRGGSGSGGGQRPPDDYLVGPHRNVRILSNGRWDIRAPGYHRVLDPEDPILTGVMQPVTSSNVHSIGFDFNYGNPLKSKLIVRYKQKDRRGGSGSVGGPTYEYQNIHPDWFNDLRQAGSKGAWVWDRLRIRGTVAGAQYPYVLVRAAQGYLPRRAIVRNGRQELRRRMRTAVHSNGREEVLRSPLANQVIGRYSPTSHRPNVGNMDRGRVERGAPNRGR